MSRALLLLLLLLLYTGKLLCYDEDSMHEAIQRASHEKISEITALFSVSNYISQHKFFGYDPRNGEV